MTRCLQVGVPREVENPRLNRLVEVLKAVGCAAVGGLPLLDTPLFPAEASLAAFVGGKAVIVGEFLQDGFPHIEVAEP